MAKKPSFSNVMALQRKPMMLEGTDTSADAEADIGLRAESELPARPTALKRTAPKALANDAGSRSGVRGDQEDRRPVRRGKRALTFWVNAEAHKQFKVLCATEDRPGQELLEMALDNLFAQFGKHRITREH
jgi:hypothetical protein